MSYKHHFNMVSFNERMGGDTDAIISILKFAINNTQERFKETKNFKQRIQIYRFAHFLRGTSANVSFEVCVKICEDLLILTDSSKNGEDQTITDEMKIKLNELDSAIQITSNIVDSYIGSKSG